MPGGGKALVNGGTTLTMKETDKNTRQQSLRETQRTLELPKQISFSFPECQTHYNVFSSLTRHLYLKHPSLDIEWSYQCCECEGRSHNRRELGKHTSDCHPTPGSPPTRHGAYSCTFCSDSFVSQRSKSQHKRNRHPIQLSKRLACIAVTEEERLIPSSQSSVTNITARPLACRGN